MGETLDLGTTAQSATQLASALLLSPLRNVALGDYLIYWLDQVHKRRLRISTYLRYKSARDTHILPHLGHIQLQSLTTRKIQQFYNLKADEGQSPSSLKNIQKVLHGALQRAVTEKLIGFNPSKGVSLPPTKRRKPQLLTSDQAKHLLRKGAGGVCENRLLHSP